MSRMLTPVLSAFAAFLVAVIAANMFGRSGSTPYRQRASSPPQSSSPNAAHRALLNASEAARARSLKTVITSFGESCDTVTRTFYQGGQDSNGAEMWNVSCQNGNAFAVSVSNDAGGSTKVIRCDVLKLLGKENCFEKF
jgi:hypothetical protein